MRRRRRRLGLLLQQVLLSFATLCLLFFRAGDGLSAATAERLHKTRAWGQPEAKEGQQGPEIWNQNRAWLVSEGPDAPRRAKEFSHNIHILVGSSSTFPACCKRSSCYTGIVFYSNISKASASLSPFLEMQKEAKGGAAAPRRSPEGPAAHPSFPGSPSPAGRQRWDHPGGKSQLPEPFPAPQLLLRADSRALKVKNAARGESKVCQRLQQSFSPAVIAWGLAKVRV